MSSRHTFRITWILACMNIEISIIFASVMFMDLLHFMSAGDFQRDSNAYLPYYISSKSSVILSSAQIWKIKLFR